ncbi:class E sortase [Streptomyces sp. NPDC002133]|uniref:class E sortase n=1 Tax=Streptomyces sp. NPDC002133 TaxID=3154409 RepID=UPI003334699C
MNGEGGSPWLRAEDAPTQPHGPQEPQEWYDPEGYQRDWYGEQGQPRYAPGPEPAPVPEPAPEPVYVPRPGRAYVHPSSSSTSTSYEPPSPPVPMPAPAPDDETVAFRSADTRQTDPGAPERPTGGRAERRKAAKASGRRRRGATAPVAAASSAKAAEGGAPLSRVEARRAARAQKDSPAVVASRAFGELFISIGVLMLLFVTYQLWWTNVRAGQERNEVASKIQDDWANGRAPGAFEPGQGFAIMHIPKLDVVVPIAEGIDKHQVLDRGMVGHYADGKLKTAMPSDEQGNFAVAGHRNTHGEPFRYINRLTPGDPIIVETQDAYYTYEMANILPQTSPSNVGVIGPVPPGSGFTKPGRYITLTTCTPEFTSTYRMIVWGKMVEERPRSKGKPDALVD